MSTTQEESLTLQAGQRLVDAWIKEFGVRYFSPLTNTAILMEEVGELARIMSRMHGDQSFKASDEGYCLEEELSDILWVVLCLANQHGISLEAAFLENVRKKTQRDRKHHIGNPKLRTGGGAAPSNPSARGA